MKEFNLNKIRATGTTTGDVYFPQTTLLLPFDGANGATTTSDSSGSNHSVTFAGTAQISTARSKFGSSSLLVDGNSDYVNMSAHSDFDFGTGDFTVECWVYAETTSALYSSFLSSVSGWSSGASSHRYDNTGQSNKFSLHLWPSDPFLSTTNTFSHDTWYHYALTRSGNTWRMFINGVQEASGTNSGSYNMGLGGLRVGQSVWDGANGYFKGNVDDIKLTKGIARYTSAFTPPTAAHLTSAGDVNKQIIVNSTADGVAIGTGGINQARIAKAWVNFNGSGTVAIRDSYNVGSITDNGTGIYTVNFSTAMTDTNYSAVMYTNATTTGVGSQQFYNTYLGGLNTRSTSSVLFESYGGNPSSPASRDALLCDLIVFGN